MVQNAHVHALAAAAAAATPAERGREMEGRIGKESHMEGGRHIERERDQTKRDLRVYSRDLLQNQDQDSPRLLRALP